MTDPTLPLRRRRKLLLLAWAVASVLFVASSTVWQTAVVGWRLFVLFGGSAVYLYIGMCLLAVDLKRRRVMRAVAELAVCAALLINGLDLFFTDFWLGHQPTVLTVRVVDRETQRSVRVFEHPGSSLETTGRTDENGEVRLTHRCNAFGIASLLRIRGCFLLSREMLAVDVEGYEKVCVPLLESMETTGMPIQEYSRKVWDASSPVLPPVEVWLQRQYQDRPPRSWPEQFAEWMLGKESRHERGRRVQPPGGRGWSIKASRPVGH